MEGGLLASNGLDSSSSSGPIQFDEQLTMAVASDNPAHVFFEGETGRNTRGLLRLIILCLIAAAAVSSRLFSVIRFESIIHECQYIGMTGGEAWVLISKDSRSLV